MLYKKKLLEQTNKIIGQVSLQQYHAITKGSEYNLDITLKQLEFNAFEKKLAVALEDTHTGSKTDKK